ncbi:MAG TPA: hypothetical protein VKQ71_14020 [Acidimicrobiales bacterium]|nr:hypothetical protein [Acidimicrobiales bacterium]
MGAIVGFVLGYVFGAKAGDNGWKELQESWKTITSSEEARDLVRGGFDITRDLVRQGAGILASRLGQTDGDSGLRSVA